MRRSPFSTRGASLAALALGLAACGPTPGQQLAREARERYVARPVPAYDARILRDSFGVAHVRGHTDADAAFGLAYAHAEDDWGTLEDVFLATRGRLAAKRGKAGAGPDFLNAWLHVREDVAAKARTAIDPATWALVEGYVAGINAFAAAHPDEVSSVARDELPMTPEDLVSGFVLTSPLFFGLDRVVLRLMDDAVLDREAAAKDKGSNGFAIAPARSGDGVTRLLANSHQPWSGPVAWYEISMHSDEGIDFAGALFPGAPVPLLGHNRTLGWTNTVNAPDLVDTYRLRLNPDDDHQYWFDGQWRTLERERVWLKVKVGWFTLPVPRVIERSVHGPVIRNRNGAFAVRYAGIGTSAALWTTYHPPEATPAIVAPRSGYVYNANNSPFKATAEADNLKRADFDPTMGIETRATNRSVRAFELLDTIPRITREALLAVKFDARYSRASWVGAVLDSMARVDTVSEPALAAAVRLLAAWDGVMADDRPAAVLATTIIGPSIRAEYRGQPRPPAAALLRAGVAWLMTHYQRLDVPLGTALRLRHGAQDLPLRGGPDVLRAVYAAPSADGRLEGDAGDSFVMLVEWGPDGVVHSESVQPFGAATSRPGSPHYADQAPLFATERFKPVWFTEAEQRAHLERETRVGAPRTP
ncbi:MAG: penicillin acylase family protein [Gemmatimonadetes bacterium]|nr:penicillin acylase family protein [Gemmatimonadota bacterium]